MSDGYVFQLNVKFDEDYDSPLLNIVGRTAEEFQANVQFASESAGEIAKAAVMLQSAYKVAKPKDEKDDKPRSSWSNQGSQRSSQPAPANSGPAPECRHGEMKYVPAGYSQRTKKNYNAFWSCTGPRNDQCETQPA